MEETSCSWLRFWMLTIWLGYVVIKVWMQGCGSTVWMNMTEKIMFIIHLPHSGSSLMAQMVKNPPAMWETWVQSLGLEDPLKEGIATHSSIRAWRIPWTEWWWPPGVQRFWAYSTGWALTLMHFFFNQPRVESACASCSLYDLRFKFLIFSVPQFPHLRNGDHYYMSSGKQMFSNLNVLILQK